MTCYRYRTKNNFNMKAITSQDWDSTRALWIRFIIERLKITKSRRKLTVIPRIWRKNNSGSKSLWHLILHNKAIGSLMRISQIDSIIWQKYTRNQCLMNQEQRNLHQRANKPTSRKLIFRRILKTCNIGLLSLRTF